MSYSNLLSYKICSSKDSYIRTPCQRCEYLKVSTYKSDFLTFWSPFSERPFSDFVMWCYYHSESKKIKQHYSLCERVFFLNQLTYLVVKHPNIFYGALISSSRHHGFHEELLKQRKRRYSDFPIEYPEQVVFELVDLSLTFDDITYDSKFTQFTNLNAYEVFVAYLVIMNPLVRDVGWYKISPGNSKNPELENKIKWADRDLANVTDFCVPKCQFSCNVINRVCPKYEMSKTLSLVSPRSMLLLSSIFMSMDFHIVDNFVSILPQSNFENRVNLAKWIKHQPREPIHRAKSRPDVVDPRILTKKRTINRAKSRHEKHINKLIFESQMAFADLVKGNVKVEHVVPEGIQDMISSIPDTFVHNIELSDASINKITKMLKDVLSLKPEVGVSIDLPVETNTVLTKLVGIMSTLTGSGSALHSNIFTALKNFDSLLSHPVTKFVAICFLSWYAYVNGSVIAAAMAVGISAMFDVNVSSINEKIMSLYDRVRGRFESIGSSDRTVDSDYGSDSDDDFYTNYSTNHFESQGLDFLSDYDMQGLISFLRINISSFFTSLLPNVKFSYNNICKMTSFFSNFDRMVSGFDTFMRFVKNALDYSVNYIRNNVFGMKKKSLFPVGIPAIDLWKDKCIAICNEMQMQKLPIDLSTLDRVGQLSVEADFILSQHGNNPNTRFVRDLINKYMKTLDPIRNALRDSNLGGSELRMEPITICITGTTGVGKTFLTHPFLDELIAKTLPSSELPRFTNDPNSFKYNRVASQVFWDGYTRQHACVFDDLFQARDGPNSPDSEANNFISLCSAMGVCLHMANLEQKANTTFTSKIVFATTNHTRFDPTSINFREAVVRRVDVPLQAFIKSEYQKGTEGVIGKGLDKEKATRGGKAFNKDVYEFKFIDYMTGKTIPGKAMSYDEVMDYCVNKYNAKVKAAEKFIAELRTRREYMVYNRVPHESETESDDYSIPSIDTDITDLTMDSTCKCSRSSLEKFDGDDEDVDEFLKAIDDLSGSEGNESRLKRVIESSKDYQPIYEKYLRSLGKLELTELDEFYSKLIVKLSETFQMPHYSSFALNSHFHACLHSYLVHNHPKWKMMEKVSKADESKLMISATVLLKEVDVTKAIDSSLYMNTLVNEDNTMQCPSHGIQNSLGKFEKVKAILARYQKPLYVVGALVSTLTAAGALYATYNYLRVKDAKQPEIDVDNVGVSQSFTHKSKSVDSRKNSRWGKHAHLYDNWRSQSTPNNLPDSQFGPDETSDSLSHSIVKKNMYQIKNSKGSTVGRVLQFKDNLVLMPFHFYNNFMCSVEDSKLETYEFINNISDKKRRYTFNSSDLVDIVSSPKLDNRDLCIVRIKCLPKCRDLSSHFVTTEFVANNEHLLLGLYALNDSACYTHFCDGEFVNDTTAVDTTRTPYIIESAVQYSVANKVGDCGTLVTAQTKNSSNGTIIGIHIAGHKSAGFGMAGLLTREIINNELSYINMNKPDKEVPISQMGIGNESAVTLDPFDLASCGAIMFPYDEWKDHPDFDSMAVIGRAIVTPYRNTETSLRPSRLRDRISHPTTAPARLRSFKRVNFDGEEEIVDPMDIALSNYDFNLPLIKPDDHLDAVGDFHFHVLHNINKIKIKPRLLNWQECIAGTEHNDNINGIPLGTSAGWPFNLPGISLSKRDIFPLKDGIIDFSGEKSESFMKVMDLIDVTVNAGLYPMLPFTGCLKDETRSLPKVEEGKTRYISGCSLYLYCLMKRYFGAFFSAMQTNNVSLGIAIGVDPYSPSWDLMYRKLVSKSSTKCVDGDFKHFDGSFNPAIYYIICNTINKWYDDEFGAVRHAIMSNYICVSKHIVGDQILAWKGKMPSGWTGTAEFSCLENMLIWRMIWYDTIENPLLRRGPFSKYVTLLVMGDDNILSLSELAALEFLPEYYKPKFSELGYTYTVADKSDGKPVFKSIFDCSFLKRGFRIDSKLGRCVGPLEIDSIYNMVSWWRTGNEERTAVINNVNTAVRELCLHNDLKYDTITSSLSSLMLEHYNYVLFVPNRISLAKTIISEF